MTASNKPPSIDMEPNENLVNIGIYLQVFISNFIRTPETKGIWPTAIIHYRMWSVVRWFSLFEIIQISGQAPWPFKWCISDYVLFLLIRYIQCHYSTHSRYWNENDFTVDKLWFFCHFILMCFFFRFTFAFVLYLLYFGGCFCPRVSWYLSITSCANCFDILIWTTLNLLFLCYDFCTFYLFSFYITYKNKEYMLCW